MECISHGRKFTLASEQIMALAIAAHKEMLKIGISPAERNKFLSLHMDRFCRANGWARVKHL